MKRSFNEIPNVAMAFMIQFIGLGWLMNSTDDLYSEKFIVAITLTSLIISILRKR